jgi:hypothetical protein
MTNRNHTTAQSDTPTQKLARVVVAIGLLLASVVALGMIPVERAAMRLNTLAPSALFDQFATGVPINLPRSDHGAALVLRSCDRALSAIPINACNPRRDKNMQQSPAAIWPNRL